MTDNQTFKRDETVKSAFQYRDALISYAYALLRDWASAEDAVQDAFIVVMDKWETFEEGSNLFAWVRRITYNKVLHQMRSRGRTVPAENENLFNSVQKVIDQNLDEKRAMKQKRMRAALQECMSRLNKVLLSLFDRFYYQKKSCEEIARQEDKTPNAVRLILSRTRSKIHDCMEHRLSSGTDS